MENIDKIIQEKIIKDLKEKFNESFTITKATIMDFLKMGEDKKEMAKLLNEVLEEYLSKDNSRELNYILNDKESEFLKTSKYISKNLDYFIRKYLDELNIKDKTEIKYEKLYNEKRQELIDFRTKIHNEKYNKKEEKVDNKKEDPFIKNIREASEKMKKHDESFRKCFF